MEELIKITEKDGIQAVSARELYMQLCDGDMSHYGRWVKVNIINNEFAIENEDFAPLAIMANVDNQQVTNPNPTTDYALTLNFAKHLCMLSRTKQGNKCRDYFIACEKKLKDEQHKKFPIPQTYSEALMLAANQAKQIEAQTKQLEEQKPKVEFFDQVTDSKDAIDMAACAKTLNIGIGRNRLFEFLRTKCILDRHNLPYQRYVDLGYFRTIEQKYMKPDGTNCINIKTIVYQKGMDYIRKLLTNK